MRSKETTETLGLKNRMFVQGREQGPFSGSRAAAGPSFSSGGRAG